MVFVAKTLLSLTGNSGGDAAAELSFVANNVINFSFLMLDYLNIFNFRFIFQLAEELELIIELNQMDCQLIKLF